MGWLAHDIFCLFFLSSSIQPVLGLSLWLGREQAVKCINTELKGSEKECDNFLTPHCQKQGHINMPTSCAYCWFAGHWTTLWSRFYNPHVLSHQKWARQCQQLARPKGWQTAFSIPLYGCFLLLAVPVPGKMGIKSLCSRAEQSQDSSAVHTTKEEGVALKNYTL